MNLSGFFPCQPGLVAGIGLVTLRSWSCCPLCDVRQLQPPAPHLLLLPMREHMMDGRGRGVSPPPSSGPERWVVVPEVRLPHDGHRQLNLSLPVDPMRAGEVIQTWQRMDTRLAAGDIT
ncbi:unnamed protein product [Pleuronectes platessa]|uniref:Uncharacterized protein n=1 Tax=Pleuronectes platessa TaxID=8262 RepID=A0A9N7VWV5_PLEPL|nr:unnamed protein product [Pleuronectes platessa]